MLHTLRLTGMGEPVEVARRFALDRDEVTEHLLDFQALGWVRRVEFAGVGGWTLTEAGRAENERQLAAELAASGVGPVVADVHTCVPAAERALPSSVHRLADPAPSR